MKRLKELSEKELETGIWFLIIYTALICLMLGSIGFQTVKELSKMKPTPDYNPCDIHDGTYTNDLIKCREELEICEEVRFDDG